MVTEISDRIRGGYENARSHLDVFHERAASSFTDMRGQVNEVPDQLRGAWNRVIDRIWFALEVPSRHDLDELVHRVDAIDRKLDRISRKVGSSSRTAAGGRTSKSAKATTRKK